MADRDMPEHCDAPRCGAAVETWRHAYRVTPTIDWTDLRAWATMVLLSEIDHPHDDSLCRVNGACLLREALRASAERIAAESAEEIGVEVTP